MEKEDNEEFARHLGYALSIMNFEILEEGLLDHGGEDDVTVLVKRIEFGLASLIAYAAYLAGKAGFVVKQNNIINIVLCGNGSKALQWSNDRFKHTLGNVFRTVASKTKEIGVNEKTRVTLIPSNATKREVAQGLVADMRLNPSSGDNQVAPKDYVRKLPMENEKYQKDMLAIFTVLMQALWNDQYFQLKEVNGWQSAGSDTDFRKTDKYYEVRQALEDIISGLIASAGDEPVRFNDVYANCVKGLSAFFRLSGDVGLRTASETYVGTKSSEEHENNDDSEFALDVDEDTESDDDHVEEDPDLESESDTLDDGANHDHDDEDSNFMRTVNE